MTLNKSPSNGSIPVSQWNSLYRGCAKNARKRGIAWQLSELDFFKIVARSVGRCEVTGLALVSSQQIGDQVNFSRNPFAPSIDRVNSNGPYSFDNCRLVAWIVNAAMNVWGDKPFWEMIEAAYINQKMPSNTVSGNGLPAASDA